MPLFIAVLRVLRKHSVVENAVESRGLRVMVVRSRGRTDIHTALSGGEDPRHVLWAVLREAGERGAEVSECIVIDVDRLRGIKLVPGRGSEPVLEPMPKRGKLVLSVVEAEHLDLHRAVSRAEALRLRVLRAELDERRRIVTVEAMLPDRIDYGIKVIKEIRRQHAKAVLEGCKRFALAYPTPRQRAIERFAYAIIPLE